MTTTESIAGHIARLQPGRPGICDWAQREVVRLRGKLEAAAVMPNGRWRDLTVKAVEHQLSALDAELARLEAPVITSRVVPGGAA